MKQYVLDTDTCVDVLRNRRDVVTALKQHSPVDLAVSTMTEAELRHGCLLSKRPEINLNLLEQFLGLVTVLPFESKAADEHAYIREKLKANPIGAHDFVIASAARATNRILVTSNVEEFGRVPGLEIENWRRAWPT